MTDQAADHPPALTIDGAALYPVHLPYPKTVQWAGHAEDGADYLILELKTKDGLTGVAEGSVKVNWAGATLRSLATVIEEVFAPRLIGIDAADQDAVKRILTRIPEHSLAKALIDIACWDLRAQAAGKPLWQLWGGDGTVPVSWTVTRAEPEAMAADAAQKVADFGFRTLKVKGGQGMETDFKVLAEIRRAVGDDIAIYVDANRAYGGDEVAEYTAGLRDYGVVAAEDPCSFRPDDSFAILQRSTAMPLLIDHDCRNFDAASLFIGQGAEALSVKLGKSGLSQSRDIIAFAAERGVHCHMGFLGESSLGALASLQLAAAIPEAARWLPSENSFFLTFTDEFVTRPLVVSGGAVTLPDSPSLGAQLDWDKVRAFAPRS